MCSDESDWTCLQPGFPIRKSTDHSLVIDSPWLIADSYVLLRFLVPRHPPCALKNLATKMLASTVKFSTYNRHPTPSTDKPCSRRGPRPEETSRHTPQPTPHHPHPPSTHNRGREAVYGRHGHASPDPSGPNNVSDTAPPSPTFHCHTLRGGSATPARGAAGLY